MSKPSKQEMIAYLCNIYESLYPFCKEQQLPPDLVDKLVYSPDEVKAASHNLSDREKLIVVHIENMKILFTLTAKRM